MSGRLTPLTARDIARFEAKVDKSAGPDKCWPWTASTSRGGYGKFWLDGRDVAAHRVAYVLANGPLPPGKPYALHSCDNPPCCNPACLFAGTQADNAADRDAKGRAATGDRHGRRTRPERTARGDRNGNHTHPESRPRGSAHGRAKLNEADIPVICAAVTCGESYAALARRYGVGKTTIRNAATGKRWVHVPSKRVADEKVARFGVKLDFEDAALEGGPS